MRVQQVQRARVGYSACAGFTWADLVKLLSRAVRLDRDTTTQAPATLVAVCRKLIPDEIMVYSSAS